MPAAWVPRGQLGLALSRGPGVVAWSRVTADDRLVLGIPEPPRRPPSVTGERVV